MGNYMSNNAVYLSAKRVLMRYNVENRAFKELEKQSRKPIAAPKHEAEFIDYHKSLKGKEIVFLVNFLFWSSLFFLVIDIRFKYYERFSYFVVTFIYKIF